MAKKQHDTTISLHPLSFEQAIQDLANSPRQKGSQAGARPDDVLGCRLAGDGVWVVCSTPDSGEQEFPRTPRCSMSFLHPDDIGLQSLNIFL